MGPLLMFVLLGQGNNLAQPPSLPSNHFNAFIFTDRCLYIWLPYKGAITSPCTIWRSNTKTGDTLPTQGSKLNTVFLCFSTQQVLRGSAASPCSTPGSAQRGVLQNPGPAGMTSLILKGPFGHVKWNIAGRLKFKMCFHETGKRISWLFKSPLWSLDAVAT